MLKVVTYYGVSVLSMSAMGFQKKFGWGGGGVGGWGELYPILFSISEICLTLQSSLGPNVDSIVKQVVGVKFLRRAN